MSNSPEPPITFNGRSNCGANKCYRKACRKYSRVILQLKVVSLSLVYSEKAKTEDPITEGLLLDQPTKDEDCSALS